MPFSILSVTSHPKWWKLMSHACSATHASAVKFHMQGILAKPRLEKRVLSLDNGEIRGAPPLRLWVKWMESLHSTQSAQAFCRELRAEEWVKDSSSDLPLEEFSLHHQLLQTQMNWCGAEVFRDQWRETSASLMKLAFIMMAQTRMRSLLSGVAGLQTSRLQRAFWVWQTHIQHCQDWAFWKHQSQKEHRMRSCMKLNICQQLEELMTSRL